MTDIGAVIGAIAMVVILVLILRRVLQADRVVTRKVREWLDREDRR